MQAIKSVKEVLTVASKQIEMLTGSRIVAFFLNQNTDAQDIQRNVDDLRASILQMFDITWEQLNAKSRKGDLPIARQLFCWYACDKLGLGVTEVSRIFNNDHTTVIHGRNKIRDFISINDPYTLEKVATLEMYLELINEKVEYEIH